MCLANLLTVLGGVAEIVGLGLVVMEILNMQHHEIPEHQTWVARSVSAVRRAGAALAGEIRRLLPGAPEQHDATVHVASMSGTSSASGSASGVLTVAGSPPTLAERVDRLEAEIKRLDEQASKDRQEMRTEARDAKARTEAVAAELRGMFEQRDRERREAVRVSLTLQWIGTLAFMVGVGLGVAGNLMPC